MTNRLKILTLDVETTIYKIHPQIKNGTPFSKKNKCVSLAIKWLGKDVETFDTLEDRGKFPTQYLQECIDRADILVGHNIKYDVHWIVREGVSVDDVKQVWCTQLGEFILTSQQASYASLNETLIKYGFPPKLDVVNTEYWDKLIDTDEVPIEILLEYNGYDAEGTENVMRKQYEQFTGKSL